MKKFIISAATALTMMSAAPAMACTVYVDRIDGNGNVHNADVSQCSYTSTHIRGHHSFAQIINRLGNIVSGIYGNGHYYEVSNFGDNEVGIHVNGRWHRTRVITHGTGNKVGLNQAGRGRSDVQMGTFGDYNTHKFDVDSDRNSRLRSTVKGSNNTTRIVIR